MDDPFLVSRFDPDRHRQEKLAADHIIQYQTGDLATVSMEMADGIKDKNKTLVELSLDFVKVLAVKHEAEMQVNECLCVAFRLYNGFISSQDVGVNVDVRVDDP